MEFFVTFSNSGELESVEMHARNIKVLEICAQISKKPAFTITYTTDEKFWKTYYDTFISKLNVHYLIHSDAQIKSPLISVLRNELRYEYRKFERHLKRYTHLQTRLTDYRLKQYS